MIQAGFHDAGNLLLGSPLQRRGPSDLLAEDALITMIGRSAPTVGPARQHDIPAQRRLNSLADLPARLRDG